MKYESLVRAILNEIGGEHNIASVTHCMTRLRFTLASAAMISSGA